MRSRVWVGLLAFALACGDDDAVTDSGPGPDAAMPDSGSTSDAAMPDSGSSSDAGLDTEDASCADGGCGAASCEDGVQNGTETDVDCGGRCDGCEVGLICSVAADCRSVSCRSGVCAASSCDDGVRNGDESGTDCGGSCLDCAAGERCVVAGDCSSGVCVENVCAAPRCSDEVANGSETDVDCGGSCADCPVGGGCATSSDCVTDVCVMDRCVAASCTDDVRNGDETSTDCGGSCGPCGVGERCDLAAECVTGVCASGFCAAPRCDDGVVNGSETDVDCGGSCDVRCASGAGCSAASDCASRVCLAGVCAAPSCTDGVVNGSETGVDCGGGCVGCVDGRPCGGGADCASGVCTGGICRVPTCVDAVQNGTETDVDCGGSCANDCTPGQGCGVSADCTTGVCTLSRCAVATCSDGVRNGGESDVDCGGSCSDCADGRACGGASDCVSGVCAGGACASPTCSDGVRNGVETDVDCGGGCAGCGRGEACSVADDCGTDGCVGGFCRVGPTASFSLSSTTGDAPLLVTATSTAVAGDAAITSVEYDFGAGFAAATSRTFTSPGSYQVRQRVTDANGFVDVAVQTVEVVDPASFDCRMSATDRTPSPTLDLTGDRLGVEWTLGSGGARSECGIAPRSGVFYFEASIEPYECDRAEVPLGCVPTTPDLLNVGVATGSASFDQNPGATSAGFDLSTGGQFYGDGAYQGTFLRELNTSWGFVLDYRGDNPVVRVVGNGWGGLAVLISATLDTTETLYAMVSGQRRKVGVEIQFNFGNDTMNRPFEHDPEAALRAAGFTEAADALVLGWSGTNALALNQRPSLSTSADVTVALGTAVTLTGMASDAEDGALSASIHWEDLATVYRARDEGVGASFTFTPRVVGLHPVRATVVDSGGKRRQRLVNVTVTGVTSTPSPVVLENNPLVDPLVGAGIDVSPDGLSARWVANDKMGLRANSSLFGGFWYFEFSRLGAAVNQGGGLVIGEGDLNPYRASLVPPSASINTLTGTWQSIIFLSGYDSTNSTYGFAVDYRGVNPIVYFIVGGSVVNEWVMHDVFVPVYPMLYGNPTGQGLPYDSRANFGATAFVQDPCAALQSYGVSASDLADLRVGWGVHATGTCP